MLRALQHRNYRLFFAGQGLVIPIYIKRGILPEIATGLGDASALRDEAQR